jgi:CheY-like chemotaxis protein
VAALIISSLGYQVLSAADGAQALALINRTRDIDLMVSDIVMSGGMDGVELARRARELRPGLPILLMSGFPTKTGSTETSEFPVLPKPYRRDALAKHIRTALGEAIASA